MKKLNVAIIGQGRSGKNIHGKYFRSESNVYFNVKYVVDADEFRRGVAEEIYPGCKTFADYTELFNIDDIDLVVNSTYSEMHYPITKDLLLHGFNVLVEKPFGRTRYECDELIKIAKDKNLTLAVFQQTFLAPFYPFAYELAKSGKLGEIKQISIRASSKLRGSFHRNQGIRVQDRWGEDRCCKRRPRISSVESASPNGEQNCCIGC